MGRFLGDLGAAAEIVARCSHRTSRWLKGKFACELDSFDQRPSDIFIENRRFVGWRRG